MIFSVVIVIAALVLFALFLWCYFEERQLVKDRKIHTKMYRNRIYYRLDGLEYTNHLLRQEIADVRRGIDKK